MIKYRVITKETIIDGMDQDEASDCLMALQYEHPETTYDIEEYNWSNVDKRLGRDPDLH